MNPLSMSGWQQSAAVKWFFFVHAQCSKTTNGSFIKKFKIEAFWGLGMVDWRGRLSSTHIRHYYCRKCLHAAEVGGLSICVEDLKHFVILQEGEEKLPEVTLKRICSCADKIIQTGARKKPQNLIEFVKKNAKFRGVGEFDQLHTPLALPNMENHKTEQLLSSKVADMNLQRKGGDACENGKEILNELSNKAERILSVFNTQMNGFDVENPVNWSVAVVAAHAMYRISHTILLSIETEEELFEQLSSMIADVMASCLTNLPCAITSNYLRNAIERREKSMQKALILLGQTEDIVQLLQQLESPISLDPQYI
ncbi:hypothetical protein F511_07108 [Dorcoceras hygrometricum]|nr:hypothetical protein F511_07108 [Dorcoceras hygrometricum]